MVFSTRSSHVFHTIVKKVELSELVLFNIAIEVIFASQIIYIAVHYVLFNFMISDEIFVK